MSDAVIANSPATTRTEPYLVGSEASLFSVSGLRLGLWPILATIGLGVLIVVPSGYVFVVLTKH
jgi:uncharacterized protein